MPAKLSFTERHAFLHVSLSGDHSSYQVLLAALQELSSHLLTTDYENLLIEYHLEKAPLSTQDLFSLGKRMGDFGLTRFRIAILIDAGRIGSDTTFFETVAGKSGISLRFFSGQDQAVEWLSRTDLIR